MSGREALTSFIAKPVMLFQAALGLSLLAVVAFGIVVGDYPMFGVGA